MPRIARKQTSAFDSSTVWFGGIVIAVSGIIALGAIFFGFSDKGAIDVAGKINSTDQTGFATPVNANSNTASANGGLKPLPADSQSAPTPEPTPAPEPTVESASSTATSTEQATAEDAPNSGLVPAEPQDSTDARTETSSAE